MDFPQDRPLAGSRFRWLSVLAFAAVLGPLCFTLNNLAIWSGILHPPAGYVPRYALSNLDVPLYLTWMTLAPTHWLLPNFHAPWASDNALLSPLVLTAGRLTHAAGLTPIVGFQVFHFVLYLAAAFALGAVIWTFCTTPRQRISAGVAIFMAIPFPLLALGWARVIGKEMPLFWIGLIQYSYETSDGLLRGGTSNSFTLSFGTAANLFGLFCLTRFVRDRRPRDLALLCLTAFLSAFFHPVEMCVIVTSSLVMFALLAYRERRLSVFLRAVVPVCVAAVTGLLPYVIQTSRSEWVRDISRIWEWHPSSVLWVPLVYGIPAVLVTYFLLMRFPLRTPGDEVLRIWFLSTIALLFVPPVPFKLHMFDGFSYITAILLVRLVSGHVHMRALLEKRPRLVYAVMAAAVVLCAPAYFTLYRQIWNDGHSAQPGLLLNAVVPREEPVLIEWVRHNLRPDQLVMSPLEVSPWLATAPIPSLATHDEFSVTFEQQSKFVNDFYAGKLSETDAAAGLALYGVHYVVMPEGSPALRFLSGRSAVGTSGPWTVYELQEGSRPRYPGLLALRPEIAAKPDFGSMVVAARKMLTR
jgi:hypothetical protein